MITFKPHIVLKDDSGTDFINQCLVLSRLLLQPTVNHCLMGQYGSEALVVILYGNVGHGLTPSVHELLHTLQVLAGLPVGLLGFTYHNTLHLFLGHILLQIVKQL